MWAWPTANSCSRFHAVSMSSPILLIRETSRWRRPAGFALAASLFVAGCATSAALHRGADAEHRQDYDRAVAEYTQALRLNPDSTDARGGLERSRLRASQDHFVKARRLSALGRLDEALVE